MIVMRYRTGYKHYYFILFSEEDVYTVFVGLYESEFIVFFFPIQFSRMGFYGMYIRFCGAFQFYPLLFP
jgi:hypothetical protein